jgi:hypothetical protein
MSGSVGDKRAPVTKAANEWRRHSALSRELRGLIFGGPVALSFIAALILSKSLPRATGPWTAALWIGIVAAVSLLTLVVFERAARRLLPLAALLNVSLLFPDKAPARFAVARRTGTPRELRERLEAARASGKLDHAEHLATVIELVLALSVHDRASRGHSERVRVFTDLLTEELKLPEGDRARLRWAALLHDVGKLEVPSKLLNKPGRPTEDEWAVLHRHPEEGALLVAPLLPWLGKWGAAVAEHHERFDGTGYPHGLKGEDISLAARIVSVADVYEVMTAPRPYKLPMSVADARAELIRVSGTQLDPAIVRAFLNISVGRLWRTIGIGAWIAQIPTLARLLSGIGTWAGAGAATVGAAGVVAVGGILSLPTPAPTNSGIVSLAPPGVVLDGPVQTRPMPKGWATIPPSTPAPTATAKATPRPAPATPKPVAPPPPKPTPTPAPRPTPAPGNPFSCAACNNHSPFCTSYCNNNNLMWCTSFCKGNNNFACRSHCFGNDDHFCRDYCVGQNDPSCVTNCRTGQSGPNLAAPLAVSEMPGQCRSGGPSSACTRSLVARAAGRPLTVSRRPVRPLRSVEPRPI